MQVRIKPYSKIVKGPRTLLSSRTTGPLEDRCIQLKISRWARTDRARQETSLSILLYHQGRATKYCSVIFVIRSTQLRLGSGKYTESTHAARISAVPGTKSTKRLPGRQNSRHNRVQYATLVRISCRLSAYASQKRYYIGVALTDIFRSISRTDRSSSLAIIIFLSLGSKKYVSHRSPSMTPLTGT